MSDSTWIEAAPTSLATTPHGNDPQPGNMQPGNPRAFTEADIPEMLIGASEFARRFDAPFLTVVEFIDADGNRNYIPVSHPGYDGALADTPERADALADAVTRLIARERAPGRAGDLQARQRAARDHVLLK